MKTNWKWWQDAAVRARVARDAAVSAANEQMQAAGRNAWSQEDFHLACHVFNRHCPEFPFEVIARGNRFLANKRKANG